MRLYIACDHRGALIEEKLVNLLKEKGYNDIYLSQLEHSSDDDYVDFALDIYDKMDIENDIGVLICGTGVGMSIIANKVKGVRCARVTNIDETISAREHNGANSLALGENLGVEKIVEIIDTFIKTPTLIDERHKRRVDKIIKFEKESYNEL